MIITFLNACNRNLCAKNYALHRLGVNDAVVVLVDCERTGLHLDADVIFFRQFRWYSPRVPASEASAILEVALFDHFALGVGDGELGLRAAGRR